MSKDKKPPVTLLEVFRYAEIYGVDITVSHSNIYPGQYVLKFSKNGRTRMLETTQHIEPDCREFDDVCRYVLEAGCEKLNRNVIEDFVERKIRPKFEQEESDK